MADYIMIVQALPPGLRWEYRFSVNNLAQAIEYTECHTAQFAGLNWFHKMLLYKEDGTPEGVFIGAFKINPTTVTMD